MFVWKDADLAEALGLRTPTREESVSLVVSVGGDLSLLPAALTSSLPLLPSQCNETSFFFEAQSKTACRHLWKCSVEHHTFFRWVSLSFVHCPNT